jgi:IS605 OrfB family transposase
MPKARGKNIRQPALEQTLIQTYQCRPPLDDQAIACLDDCAKLFSRIEHSLFADLVRLGIAVPPKTDSSKKPGSAKKITTPKTTATGKKARSTKPADVLKRDTLTREQITSRQYNAILARIKGQISSIIERRPGLIEELEGRIETQKRQIKNVEKRVAAAKSRKVIDNGKDEIHNRKRKLANMEYRLALLKADEANNKVRLCFGSKKLFLAQYHLEKNHFETRADWKAAWQAARCCQVYFIGSMDETKGNQTAQFHVSGDHLLTLTLRVPDKLHAQYGKFLVISNIHVEYGFDAIVAALEECRLRSRLKTRKDDTYKEHGQAISVRFEKDTKGWRLLITTGLARPEVVTSKKQGVFGVDLNADHIAVVETDRYGNPIERWSIAWNGYGLSQTQAEALTSAVVVQLVELAGQAGKPIVIERLDFQGKKKALKEQSKRYARMLSSFAYKRFYAMLTARAFRKGVEVWTVNPAYTSVIGRVKFMQQYGLTVHQAAALVIGRRFLGRSEQPPRRWGAIPDGRNRPFTFAAPVRMRKPDGRPAKHIWGFWADVSKQLKAAHVARRREDQGWAWLDRLRQRLQSAASGRGTMVSPGQPTRKSRVAPAEVTYA